jgi:hypothetical protein
LRLRRPPLSTRADCGSESVAAAELGKDEIAVFAKGSPQRGNLHFQILLGDDNARPDANEKLLFGDQRSIGLQQGQQELEGARSQRYRGVVCQQ